MFILKSFFFITKKRSFQIALLLTLATITIFFLYKNQKTPFFKKNSPFVTIEFQGNLGNRLFQSAAGIALAIDNNANFILDKKYKKSKALKTLLHNMTFTQITNTEETYEQKYPFNFEKIPFSPNMKLKGFFESERYFSNHKDTIIRLFSPSKRLERKIRNKYKKILSHPKNVALHIRTFYKDFLGTGESLYDLFPAPDITYIEKAINIFDEDSLFIVCSDHIPYCRKLLSHINRNFIFIENKSPVVDFYLLSMCKNMITSNSTFSWWAAYLNKNKDKTIVCRTPWSLDINRNTGDIILSDWMKIEGEEKPLVPNF